MIFTVLLVYWPFGHLQLWNVWSCLCLFIKSGLNYIIVIDFRNSLYTPVELLCSIYVVISIAIHLPLLRTFSHNFRDSYQQIAFIVKFFRNCLSCTDPCHSRSCLFLRWATFKDCSMWECKGQLWKSSAFYKVRQTLLTDFSSTSFSSSPVFFSFFPQVLIPKMFLKYVN